MCMVCILTVQAGTDVMHVLWNRRLRCCTLCYQLYTFTPSTMTDLSLITCTSVPSTRSQTEQISRIYTFNNNTRVSTKHCSYIHVYQTHYIQTFLKHTFYHCLTIISCVCQMKRWYVVVLFDLFVTK